MFIKMLKSCRLWALSPILAICLGFHVGALAEEEPPVEKPAEIKVLKTLKLFNGKDLSGWKETRFTGAGEVKVEEGTLILDHGYMTGVHWTNAAILPKLNYEIEVEASRVNGSDFFCGLTFPIGNTNSTLVVGGWGGGVVGISTIDGFDASENETTTYHRFEEGQFYKIKLRVTDTKLQAWIDEEQVVDVDTPGRKFGMRFGDIELSVPLGVASWSTTSGIKNIELRLLEPGKEKP